MKEIESKQTNKQAKHQPRKSKDDQDKQNKPRDWAVAERPRSNEELFCWTERESPFGEGGGAGKWNGEGKSGNEEWERREEKSAGYGRTHRQARGRWEGRTAETKTEKRLQRIETDKQAASQTNKLEDR